MVKVKTKRQYCSPYSCKNKDKLALGIIRKTKCFRILE